MENKITILFYGRNINKKADKCINIYLRITINGKRIDQSLNRQIEKSQWSKVAGKMKGNTAVSRNMNGFLDAIKNKVYEVERNLIRDGKVITYETFRDSWFGIDNKPYMLIEIFQQHNQQVNELIGKDFTAATYQRYQTSMGHTKSFIKWKYNADDIDIKTLNYEFINDYSFWLRSKRNCSHNTTMKYLANFKKIVLLCIKNGWLQKDPFFGFKLSKKEVERPFLNATELQEMITKELKMERLALVRDIFIFSCYTGLAYADVKKLKRNEIGVGVDGEQWIFTLRKKTDTSSRIPLLPTSLALLRKYENHVQCKEGRLLPILSNQKMNAYLKEIADLCSIDKNLTFHTARHTFATTVTLSNGVPIETVSKMLGHRNLRTTQHYAKILDIKVSEDMKALRDRLANKVN